MGERNTLEWERALLLISQKFTLFINEMFIDILLELDINWARHQVLSYADILRNKHDKFCLQMHAFDLLMLGRNTNYMNLKHILYDIFRKENREHKYIQFCIQEGLQGLLI
jgi:hypothetical protein